MGAYQVLENVHVSFALQGATSITMRRGGSSQVPGRGDAIAQVQRANESTVDSIEMPSGYPS